jgi:hypothetical protein
VIRAILGGLLLAACAVGQTPQITAQQVIERIQKEVGIAWRTPTVDTFKAGDPNTPVTGIAVTMMATLDVLQRAAATRKNLVITHEPTFYTTRMVLRILKSKMTRFSRPKRLSFESITWWCGGFTITGT